MRTALAVAVAAGVSWLGVSAASAQDCVNGYRTLGNGVIALCDEAGPAGGLPADYREDMQGTEAFDIEEPMVTGSIAPSPGGALPPEYREDVMGSEGLDEGPMVTGSIAPAAGGALPPEYREDVMGSEGLDEGPMVTGSIAPATGAGLPPEYREDTQAAEGGIQEPPAIAMEAEGPFDCQPGQYWTVGGEGRDTPVLCR